MTPSIVIKRGDTFVVAGVYGDPPVDITSVTIASQMKRAAVTVTAAVDKTDAPNGAYTLTIDAATTATMEAGDWSWDIQYMVGGVVVSAPGDTNMRVRVIDGVTA